MSKATNLSTDTNLSVAVSESIQESVPAVDVHLLGNFPVCVSCYWMHCI
jgi:hypothetical protein